MYFKEHLLENLRWQLNTAKIFVLVNIVSIGFLFESTAASKLSIIQYLKKYINVKIKIKAMNFLVLRMAMNVTAVITLLISFRHLKANAINRVMVIRCRSVVVLGAWIFFKIILMRTGQQSKKIPRVWIIGFLKMSDNWIYKDWFLNDVESNILKQEF